MSIEWFFKLKEIDSLSKMRINHLKAISEQEDRLLKLNKRLEDSLLHSENFKQEHFKLGQDLHELEKKLSILQNQRQLLMDRGALYEKYDTEIDFTEGSGLELLDKIEANEKALSEQKEFEAGLSKTISEIKAEVDEIKSTEEISIKNLDMRLGLLMEELPQDHRELLIKLQKKNLAHGPFTRNEGGSCYFCRYKISRIDESEIDLEHQLKQCPQCSRIFLPYGS